MSGDRRFRALLLGNWEYEDPDRVLQPLRGPRNDVQHLREALTHPDFGLFTEDDVVVRENLTSQDVGTALFNFVEDARPTDNLLIYYSGHGERLTGEELGLCGVEVRHRTRDAEAFGTKRLRAWLEQRNRAPTTIIILDCCYAGQYKGALTDDALAVSFGSGTVVLSSGGNEPSPDALGEDDLSPFTAALVEKLLDSELAGNGSGLLSTHEIYNALLVRQPKLLPAPRQNIKAQGEIALARRPVPEDTVVAQSVLRGWRDDQVVETIELAFADGRVAVRGDSVGGEVHDLATLDANRQAAVRRLSQLADAVTRSAEYTADPWWQRAVRRAWDCVGVNLYEAAIPPAVQNRITAAGDDDTGTKVLRLRLRFDDDAARLLECYPWECLQLPETRVTAEAEGPEYRPLRPLALRRGVLLERVTPAQLAAPIGAPASLRGGRPEFGVVNALPAPYASIGTRTRDELNALPGMEMLFHLEGASTSWDSLLEAMENGPDYLLLFAPVQRWGRSAKIGLHRAGGTDWRDVTDLVTELRDLALTFSALVFVTFTAAPGSDTVRGTYELARTLSNHHAGPVIFACHAPGFEAVVGQLAEGRPGTFPGLLLDALSRGKPLDRSIYYARDQVMRRASAEFVELFGVHGYYVAEYTGPDAAPTPSRNAGSHSRPAGASSPTERLPGAPVVSGGSR